MRLNKDFKETNSTRFLNKPQKDLDLMFGKQSEDKVQRILRQHFNSRVEKYTNKYSIFDYWICNEKGKITDMIELKSRRNDATKYPTQLIGMNKYLRALKEIRENGVDVWFCFKLTCGLYIYKVNPKDQFKTIFTGNYYRGDKTDELILIPNTFLTKIDTI